MKDKQFLLLLLFIIPINLLFAQTFSSNFKSISIEEGLSQTTVNTIIQDKDGFIWAGTSDGLNRYDGNEILVFRSNPTDSTSLSDNRINKLAEDKYGNIWVATGSGGVSKYNPTTHIFKRYMFLPQGKSLISNNVINIIFIDSNNRMWAGHQNGIDL